MQTDVIQAGRERRKEARDTVAKRQARFRRKVLEGLWAPRGVGTCPGPDSCPWRPDDEPCACRAGLTCHCEREAFKILSEEGRSFFGSIALSGLAAATILATARASLQGDPAAMDHKLRLLTILASDSRKHQDLAQRERRLALEEASRKPKTPSLTSYLEKRSKAVARSKPSADTATEASFTVEAVDMEPAGEASVADSGQIQPEAPQAAREASEPTASTKVATVPENVPESKPEALPAVQADMRWIPRPGLAPPPYPRQPPVLAIADGTDGPRAAIDRLEGKPTAAPKQKWKDEPGLFRNGGYIP